MAGEVDIRCRSSNQRICSSVASGMKIEVKTRRKIGSSFAQPTRIMLRYVSSSMSPSPSWTTGMPQTVPLRTSRVTRLGMGDREGQRDRGAAGHAEEGEPLEPGRLHDRLEIAQARLEAEVVDVPVGHAEAALVVADDRGDRRRAPSRKWRQTGLCQSCWRWLSQHEATTSGGPDPWTA